MPVGTDPQPLVAATSSMYSREVAHSMNVFASSACLVPAGTARAHAQSQLAPREVTATGACAKATLSATFDWRESVTKLAAMVASIHIPHLPSFISARISLKLLASDPGGPYSVSRST